MVTKDQAIKAGEWLSVSREFHYTGKHECTRVVGPKGGIKTHITTVRASGKCQIWKTRPNEFKLPVKYGMYESAYITHENASDWHVVSECPLETELA